jgi:hypothetical protein
MIIGWNVAIKLWPLFKYLVRHCPGIDVANSIVELGRNLILPRFEISRVAIAEFEGPKDPKTFAKELPEIIAAVIMLVENEAFSKSRPHKIVNGV